MTSNYCINCWYPLGTEYVKDCPDCGYPDHEGEEMSLEELIAEYYDGEEFSDVRKSRMIDLLVQERQKSIEENRQEEKRQYLKEKTKK